MSISGAIILTVIVTCVLIGGTTLAAWSRSMREDLGRRMTDLIAVIAQDIDPALHASLRVSADMEGPAYKALRDRLLEARKAVPDISYLYSFRMEPGSDKPVFVLDTGTVGDDFSALGDVYEDSTPTLLESFKPPYKVRVEPSFAKDQWGTWLSAFAPILRSDGTLEGILGMDMAASYVGELQNRLLLTLLAVGGAITLVMILFSIFMARAIARPLLELSDDMSNIARLQLDTSVVAKTGIKEVFLMEEALENMKKGLRSFRKYVPADLVTQLVGMKQEAILGTRREELTVFFCDLANFTTFSERLAPEELSRLMSRYFVAVTDALQKEGATIDKFIGDAVMAFWNAPQPLEDHAIRGLRASLAVQKAFSEALVGGFGEGLPELSVRVGLATGEVMVGNMGHEGRLSYTAIGDAVNLASRLESLNKYYGTRILVAGATLKRAGNKMHFRPIDRVAVKGKDEGILIAEIAEKPPAWWASYVEAWKFYREADWARARPGFAALAAQPGLLDGPSRILAARCATFLEKGPPSGWNGTWIMQEK